MNWNIFCRFIMDNLINNIDARQIYSSSFQDCHSSQQVLCPATDWAENIGQTLETFGTLHWAISIKIMFCQSSKRLISYFLLNNTCFAFFVEEADSDWWMQKICHRRNLRIIFVIEISRCSTKESKPWTPWDWCFCKDSSLWPYGSHKEGCKNSWEHIH